MSQDQTSAARWRRYKQQTTKLPGLGITLDISKMDASNAFFKEMAGPMDEAFAAMAELEKGAIANPDEDRMVGHYWLRAPHLAPNAELKGQIEKDLVDIEAFARKVHKKELTPPGGSRFTDLLIIGVGGSALGPQLMADSLGKKNDKLKVHFFDNTDSDGMQRTVERIGSKLKSTLVLVISKSGGTPETRNGMLEAKAVFEAKGLDFAKQAVAVTGEGSKLDKVAASGGWLARFPMYDWVGGRTSIWSGVGLLPMALQGIDIGKFLEGAAKMDALTRQDNVKKNPAAQLALMWHLATNGKGEKDMVILPYKDRLCLFSKYLQQLVMESLGKQLDLDGNEVYQGIAVYGNKGSTDQHAYVQQLRDGVNNFFATFIVVLQDTARPGRDPLVEVEEGITSGDYLHGFYQGTRQALYEAGRHSMTILCDKVDPKTVGALTALYERAVGFYASLVNINAYHQPGVEAGKKAAAVVLDVQKKAVAYVNGKPGQSSGAEEIAEVIGAEDVESVFMIMEHLAANKRVTRQRGGYTAL